MPEQFLAEAVAYFEWAEENPLQEENVNVHRGAVIRYDTSKMRPFTKQGLATYLGITVNALNRFKTKEGFEEAFELIEQVLYDQKFTGAATGLMNATIISRDLGLADKQELTGKDGEPLHQVVQYELPNNGRD